MTDTPHTADDLLDLWAGTAAPSEAKMRHPSHWEPIILRVVGSPYTVQETTPGVWGAYRDGRQVAAPAPLSHLEAFRLVCLLADCPRAETQGPRPGPTPRFWRGVAWAVPASLALWAVIIWAGGRIWGAW